MEKAMLVFQTDFTYKEGAVCAMYGVVKSVDGVLAPVFTNSYKSERDFIVLAGAPGGVRLPA